MNNTKKITLVSAFALLLAFGGFFLYVILYENSLTSYSTSDTESLDSTSNVKKIFILGGSNTLTLNVTHMEKYLSDKGLHQYRVYMLGHIYDSPSQRLEDLELMISSEPSIVLYGMAFRSLGYQELDNRHKCSDQEELIGDYTDYLQRELKRDKNTLTFLPSDNQLFPAINDVGEYFEQIFPNQTDIFSSFANPKHVTVNVLRILLEESDSTDKQKRSIPGQIDNRLWHLASLDAFSNIISMEDVNKPMFRGKIPICPEDLNKELTSLKKIISKLNENNVKVIIFFNPYAQSYLNVVGESEVDNAHNLLEKLSIENNAEFYSLHDDYIELEIWNNWSHVARHPDAVIYSNDVADFIIKNVDPYSNLRTVDTTIDDLRFMDLSNSDLRGVDLSNKDLTGADLHNSNLFGANLAGTILKEVNLSYAYLRDSDLSGKDLSGTILLGADLVGANLNNVSLSGMDLTAADLSHADLSYKDLSGTILTGANLEFGNLTGVDLSGKDLTGTDLKGADLGGQDLAGTILTGADLSHSDLIGANLSGKDLSGTSLRAAELNGKDFTGSILTGTLFGAANLNFVDFSGMNLSNSEFTLAKLYGANFSGADLYDADFAGAILSKADFSGANLLNAQFNIGNLTTWDFFVANLTDTNFSSCQNHPICD